MDTPIRVLIILSLIATVLSDGADGASTWSYHGDDGPSHWEDTFEDCGSDSQSPIDIISKDAEYSSGLTDFIFSGWDADNLTMELSNNGHTAVVGVTGDVSTRGGALPDTYNLVQFHFHWGDVNTEGSEHEVDGKQYPLEVHFVHFANLQGNISHAVDKDEGLAVLGFFFEITESDNEALTSLVSSLEQVKYKDDHTTLTPFKLDTLFGYDLENYWRYSGSLTTPGCFESVIWTVFKEPVGISESQLEAFRGLMENKNGTAIDNETEDEFISENFRPVQDLNGRKVTTSTKPEDKDTSGATYHIARLVTAIVPIVLLALIR